MAKKKPVIMMTNELIKEISGVDRLEMTRQEAPAEMNKAELLLSRMETTRFLLSYVNSGRFLEEVIEAGIYKRERFSSHWWKQFRYTINGCVGRYSKNARFIAAAMNIVLDPHDRDLISTGDAAALSRLDIAGQCAFLMSALHPDSDHAFFKASIGEMPNFTKTKSYPVFTQAPDVTDEERAEITAIWEGVKPIYEKDTSRPAAEIIAQYIFIKYAPIEEKDSATSYAKLGKRLITISDKDYQFALDPRLGSPAYVQPLPKDVMSGLSFDDKTGILSSANSTDAALKVLYGTLEDRNTSDIISKHDFLFLRTALTAIYKNPESIDQNYVTVKRTELGKHLGINLSAGNTIDVVAKMKPLENLIGRTPDGSWWRVFVSMGYNQQTDSFTFACPFINRIVLNLEETNRKETKTKSKGLVTYSAPHYNFLLHSSISKERNVRAVEIVTAITNLLLQRAGSTTKKRNGEEPFKAHIKYSTLISYCEHIQTYLVECKDNSNKNKMLKAAFAKAYDLLKPDGKTDAHLYFLNLKIPQMLPTCATLDKTIEITFDGINTGYKLPD